MRIEFNPKVKWLLVQQSEKKMIMHYMDKRWEMPVIAKRPPYYDNPLYEPYYPKV